MPEHKTVSPSQRQMAENGQPLKKWDKLVKRNANGQFERGSKALAGAGRPPGSKNRTTLALREAILAALDEVGGSQYLAKLALENSSAFASLLGKVLPTTLAPDSSGGNNQIVFTRVIVGVDGHRHIEGVTPKQLPAPSPVSVENNDQLICVEKPSENSASDDQ